MLPDAEFLVPLIDRFVDISQTAMPDPFVQSIAIGYQVPIHLNCLSAVTTLCCRHVRSALLHSRPDARLKATSCTILGMTPIDVGPTVSFHNYWSTDSALDNESSIFPVICCSLRHSRVRPPLVTIPNQRVRSNPAFSCRPKTFLSARFDFVVGLPVSDTYKPYCPLVRA